MKILLFLFFITYYYMDWRYNQYNIFFILSFVKVKVTSSTTEEQKMKCGFEEIFLKWKGVIFKFLQRYSAKLFIHKTKNKLDFVAFEINP